MNIHIWTPGLVSSSGGIQTFSRFFVQALVELLPEAELLLLVKNDTRESVGDCPASIPCICAGDIPEHVRTVYFAGLLLWYALTKKPDLIIMTHLHFSPVAKFILGLCGVPYWVVAHGTEAWGLEKPRLRNALWFADKVLAVSNYTRDRLVDESGLQPDSVAVFHNTFDEERFCINQQAEALRETLGIPSAAKVLLTVARLDAEKQMKGYDTVIQSLAQIRQTIPDIVYIIAGTGPDKDRLDQLVQKMNLQDVVKRVGFIPDAALPAYYQLCDLFILPGTGEGFGIVFLEAMACGKPVIAGNADGSIDALGDGALGVLVDPRSTQDIAAAVCSVLNGEVDLPILYNPAALRSEVIRRFGFSAFCSALAALLEDFAVRNR